MHTFKMVTRSAAWRRVRPEISSTILFSFGSAGGGGAGDDVDGAAAVARHREGPANVLELVCQVSELCGTKQAANLGD